MAGPPQAADLGKADRIIRGTTTASVVVLALIAGAISYRHLHTLAIRHGESPWSAALLPLSVDGMVVCASMALLTESRRGKRGGLMPWTLLVLGSTASIAANIAVAEPSVIGRAVAAWPALALIGGMEMLMRMIRTRVCQLTQVVIANSAEETSFERPPAESETHRTRGQALQRQAWQWAQSHRHADGSLPSGIAIAQAFGRSPRWGRLVKSIGLAGGLG
ncbi:DUF2637 domain-containing protein [Streptosporangium sp. NPDC051022]|uniref:DUF2637 domain-containing protein n=1 Tax=Streptosporangium sp. NPDC051022 TaxID=3155752 RepID=UPI0034490426